MSTGRRFIGMEKDPTFYISAKEWLAAEQARMNNETSANDGHEQA